ncbi:Pre-mRNA 3' end processing protein WDR33 [Durusdinium trenchii]|uniref:Pre-mRNA 3' end processing protein WDR33 n=1 Tax=Durusdinium trenchii TaxID=1381693 RepID=A0ABP0QYU1_9DINO
MSIKNAYFGRIPDKTCFFHSKWIFRKMHGIGCSKKIAESLHSLRVIWRGPNGLTLLMEAPDGQSVDEATGLIAVVSSHEDHEVMKLEGQKRAHCDYSTRFWSRARPGDRAFEQFLPKRVGLGATEATAVVETPPAGESEEILQSGVFAELPAPPPTEERLAILNGTLALAPAPEPEKAPEPTEEEEKEKDTTPMVGLSLGQGPKARNVFDTTDFDAEEKPEKRVLTKVEPTEEKTRKMAKVEPVEEKPVSAKVEPVEAPPAPTHSAEAVAPAELAQADEKPTPSLVKVEEIEQSKNS